MKTASIWSITAAAMLWCSVATAAAVPQRSQITTRDEPVATAPAQMRVYDFFSSGLSNNINYVSFHVDPGHPSVSGNYSCADIRPSPSRALQDITTPVNCDPPFQGMPALSFTYALSTYGASRDLTISVDLGFGKALVGVHVIPDFDLQWVQDPTTGFWLEQYVGPVDFAVENAQEG